MFTFTPSRTTNQVPEQSPEVVDAVGRRLWQEPDPSAGREERLRPQRRRPAVALEAFFCSDPDQTPCVLGIFPPEGRCPVASAESGAAPQKISSLGRVLTGTAAAECQTGCPPKNRGYSERARRRFLVIRSSQTAPGASSLTASI
jgi:hypothetical protein